MKKKKNEARMTHLIIMPVCRVSVQGSGDGSASVWGEEAYIAVPESIPEALDGTIQILDAVPLGQHHD